MPAGQRRRQLPDRSELGLGCGQGATDPKQRVVADDPEWGLVFLFRSVFTPAVQLAQHRETACRKGPCTFEPQVSLVICAGTGTGPAEEFQLSEFFFSPREPAQRAQSLLE